MSDRAEVRETGLAEEGRNGYFPPACPWSGETETARRKRDRLRTGERWSAAAWALALLVPLALAGWLCPSPNGLGTHQQLGLPPCTFRVLFGCRCPSCGMTTAWAHVVRGELAGALAANAGGAVLALLAVASVPWLLGAAAVGRWPGFRPHPDLLAWVLMAVVAITLLDWAVRMLDAYV